MKNCKKILLILILIFLFNSRPISAETPYCEETKLGSVSGSSESGTRCVMMKTGCSAVCAGGWTDYTADRSKWGGESGSSLNANEICPGGQLITDAVSCHKSTNSKKCENNVYCYKCIGGTGETEVIEPDSKACNRNRVANNPNACCGPGGSHSAGCSGRSECGSHVYKYASGCGGYCGAQVDTECVRSQRNRQTYPNDRWGGNSSHTYWRGQFGPKSFYEGCSGCPAITCCAEYRPCWCCCGVSCDSKGCYCTSSCICQCCVRWEKRYPCANPTNWRSGYRYNCDEPVTCAEKSDTTYSASPSKFRFNGTDIGQTSPTCTGVKLAKYSTWTDGWCDTCYDCNDKPCNTKINIYTVGNPVGCSTQSGYQNHFKVQVDDGTSSGNILYNGTGNFSFSYNGIGKKNKVTFKVIPTITYGTIEPEFTLQDGVCTAHWWADSEHDYQDTYGYAEQNGRWELTDFSGAGGLSGGDMVQDGSCSWNGCDITCQIDVYNENGFITTACGTGHTLELNLQLRFVPDLRVVTAYDGPGDAAYIPETPKNGVYALTDTCLDYPAAAADTPLGGFSDNLFEHQKVVRAKGSYKLSFDNVSPGAYTTPIFSGKRSLKNGESIITQDQNFFLNQLYGVEELNSSANLRTVLNNAKTNRGYWSCACPTAIATDNEAKNLTCGYEINPTQEAQACVTKRTYVSFVPCTNAPWFQASGGNIYGYDGVNDNVPLNNTEGCGGEDKCLDNSQGNNDTNWFSKEVTSQNYKENFASTSTSTTGTSYSCTPRIIRGRTACKSEGESASAGIVLTHNDTNLIQANTKVNSKFALSYTEGDLANLALRITERANKFAINQTPYSDDNNNTKVGIIQPTAATRVGAFTNTVKTYSRPGFTPRREGWEYFMTLANTYGLNNQISSYANKNYNTVDVERDGLNNLDNWCYQIPAEEDLDRNKIHKGEDDIEYQGYINYICYVGSDLNITDGKKWRLQGYHKDLETSAKYQRKVTIFVNGNLIVGTPDYYEDYDNITRGRTSDSLSDEGLILVDVGNFLGFIVNKDIVVQASAGINMPAPDVDNDRVATICWEGQNAAIPGQVNPTTNVADNHGFVAAMYNPQQPSTTGVMEGLYIAEGALRIRSSHFTYNADTKTADGNKIFNGRQSGSESGSYKCKVTRADKRFIGHGSFITWGGTVFDRDFNYYTDNYITQCQAYIQELDKAQGNGGIDPIGLVEASYNNRAPIDSFVYRADLVRNTPAWMKVSLFNIVEY